MTTDLTPDVPAMPSASGSGSGRRWWAFGIVALLIVLGPTIAYPVFLMKVMCFALFAAGFNLLLGFGGLLSFGHAAFFGCGSYVSAYAAKSWGWPPEAAVGIGTLASALLGLVFGAVAIRRQGIYFAMITLALAQLVYFVCLEVPLTGGEDGLQSVPRGRLLGLIDLSSDLALYATVGTMFFLALLLVFRIVNSPFGHVLRAIRDNEARAISLGYKTDRYRLAVFVLSTLVCGLAGAMKAIVFQLASLTDVHWTTSGEVVLMTLVGGMGTLFGPLVGAAVVVGAEFYLASIGSWVQVIEGGIFVACVLGFRAGIVGTLGDISRRAHAVHLRRGTRSFLN